MPHIDSFFPHIQAVIFDMDGLLIDSEPYWKIAEKKVFGELGLQLDDELLRQVMGFRLSEVVKHWYAYQPWPNPDFERTEEDVLNCVMELIANHAEALPGVQHLLAYLHERNIPMAVASSSAMRLIEAVVDKLDIRKYFQLLWSAEYEPYGKPHPGIFITTAQKLGIEPTKCLVLEDSVNGVIAAKAARMACIAVPEEVMFEDDRFAIADVKIATLEELLSSQ
jgi:sugar-phosphatase